MGKHKKFLRSEKAKIKLKGVKLAKGLNVTKTEFKVRKIVIKEQLANGNILTSDGTVIRKQNIKELMSKLKSHNSSHKTDALKSLKETFSVFPVDVKRSLESVLQGLSQLSLDCDKEVRRESFRVLTALFSIVATDAILPFFPIISSYLRCAMTHIQNSIQEDSLFFLDVLIQYCPDLVAINNEAIFTCFLDMISKLRSESKPERTLTMNLASKLTSVKWRTKVLERLLKMLDIIVDAKYKGNSKQSGYISHSGTKTIQLEGNAINRYPLIRQYSIGLCPLNVGQENKKNSVLDNTDDAGKIKKYVGVLVPLIFEAWLEVNPRNINSEMHIHEKIISNEAAQVLLIVTNILVRLWELMKLTELEANNSDVTDWFSFTYANDFSNFFLNSFPHRQNDGVSASKRKSKGAVTERDVLEAGGGRCHTQNMWIIFLFSNCCVGKNTTLKKDDMVKQSEVLLQYLLKNARYFPWTDSRFSSQFLKVMNSVLVDHGLIWLKLNNNVEVVLKEVLRLYLTDGIPKEVRNKVLVLLCNIVLNHKLYQRYGATLFDDWLGSLYKVLLQPHISIVTVNTLSNLCRQKNQIFLKSLEDNWKVIIRNLSILHVTDIDPIAGRKLIINLFYWSNLNLSEILPKVNDEVIDKEIIELIKSIRDLQSL